MALTILDVKSVNNSSSATSLVLPSTVAPPTGCLVLVVMATAPGTVTHQAPTDNFGNSYVQVGATLSVTSGSVIQLSLWRCDGATTDGVTALTVTLHTSGVDQIAGVVWVVSGQGKPSYNGDTVGQTAVSTNAHSGTSTPAPPTTSLFLGGMTNVSPGTPTEGTGWNTTGVNGFTTAMHTAAILSDNSVGQSVYSEYLVASSAQDAAWTTASNSWLADVASFAQFASPPPLRGGRPFPFKPGSARR